MLCTKWEGYKMKFVLEVTVVGNNLSPRDQAWQIRTAIMDSEQCLKDALWQNKPLVMIEKPVFYKGHEVGKIELTA